MAPNPALSFFRKVRRRCSSPFVDDVVRVPWILFDHVRFAGRVAKLSRPCAVPFERGLAQFGRQRTALH